MSSSVRLLSLSIIALWKLPAITAAAVPATSERYCRQFCPPQKADQAFFPNDDARYQNRRKRRLHDRHVRGEDESSHLQNALAGYIRILTTEGFTYFDNAKQLSRFIGICPTYQQSRTSVNIREHINRNDDERLRSLLYIAFWTALRYNSRECYIRLKANEKPFKVALIAVTNKLVRPVLTITTINSIYRWICPG